MYIYIYTVWESNTNAYGLISFTNLSNVSFAIPIGDNSLLFDIVSSYRDLIKNCHFIDIFITSDEIFFQCPYEFYSLTNFSNVPLAIRIGDNSLSFDIFSSYNILIKIVILQNLFITSDKILFQCLWAHLLYKFVKCFFSYI